jgi:hypothetical protein
MRLLLIFLLAGLSACATVEEDPWQDLTVDMKPATGPVDCGSFPLPSEQIGDSIVYDNAGLNDLDDYRLCSEDNAAIVTEHAAQIGQLKIARRDLTEAGQSQRNIAEMRAEMLRDERQHALYTSIAYWVVIIALGAAL